MCPCTPSPLQPCNLVPHVLLHFAVGMLDLEDIGGAMAKIKAAPVAKKMVNASLAKNLTKQAWPL